MTNSVLFCILTKSVAGDAPAAMLVQVASKHASNIYLESEGRKVNAKSIMGMMSLALAPGEKVTVIADGTDEDDAIFGMENYLRSAAE